MNAIYMVAAFALLSLNCTASIAQGAEAPTAAPARTLFFMSDLHMGVGKNMPEKYANQEDFRWHDDLSAWLNEADRSTSSSAELVLLGDIFELWQSSLQVCKGDGATFECETTDCRPEDNGKGFGCTEEQALARVQHAIRQHQKTLDALSAFAQKGQNRLVLVPGNHDAALLLPKVRVAVLNAFKDPGENRVSISKTGYWLSNDKKIYADHGHMYDRVNKFEGWPQPYETRPSGLVMQQPWGEDMVQHFYNQYEELLPAIDNVSDEIAGAQLGVSVLGASAGRVAAQRFIKFLIIDTTLLQKLAFLGEHDADDDDLTLGGTAEEGVKWDFAAIRKGDAGKFLVESMPVDHLRDVAQDADMKIAWADITDDDIATACEQRKVLIEYYQKAEPEHAGKFATCVVTGNDTLGYVADKILARDSRNRRKFLAATGKTVGSQFDVYVYGHTHTAVAPFTQKIASLWDVSVVNDGAFQRTISPQQLEALAGDKSKMGQMFANLTPEGMRPCYSYVRIDPYAANSKPMAELKWWSFSKGKWSERSDCPPWPPKNAATEQ